MHFKKAFDLAPTPGLLGHDSVNASLFALWIYANQFTGCRHRHLAVITHRTQFGNDMTLIHRPFSDNRFCDAPAIRLYAQAVALFSFEAVTLVEYRPWTTMEHSRSKGAGRLLRFVPGDPDSSALCQMFELECEPDSLPTVRFHDTTLLAGKDAYGLLGFDPLFRPTTMARDFPLDSAENWLSRGRIPLGITPYSPDRLINRVKGQSTQAIFDAVTGHLLSPMLELLGRPKGLRITAEERIRWRDTLFLPPEQRVTPPLFDPVQVWHIEARLWTGMGELINNHLADSAVWSYFEQENEIPVGQMVDVLTEFGECLGRAVVSGYRQTNVLTLADGAPLEVSAFAWVGALPGFGLYETDVWVPILACGELQISRPDVKLVVYAADETGEEVKSESAT